MKIRDILVVDIQAGKNWRILEADIAVCLDMPMLDWGPIVEVQHFELSDSVVYSALTVYESGRVEPVVWIKQVGDFDYGGDYCVFVEGHWEELGVVPNPNAESGDTFCANPLPYDPSFEATDYDYRQCHREGFYLHAHRLPV